MIPHPPPPPIRSPAAQTAMVVQVATRAADRLWPGQVNGPTRCPNGVTITWKLNKWVQKDAWRRLDADAARRGMPAPAHEPLVAFNTGCLIVASNDGYISLRSACNTIVHELGHAAGQPHSPDPHNIMFKFGGRVPECDFYK